MSGGCQIDFYVLRSETLDAQQLACRLALMAWERGHRVVIVTEGRQAVAALDELMWSYPEGRFLPHEPDDNGASPAPVRILSSAPTESADVVINLTAEALPEPGRFARLLEIVPCRRGEREASRRKFRTYRSLGIVPENHDVA